jgi:hypothetical protein
MGIKFGTLDVSAIKLGTSTVSKVYQGTDLVYSAETLAIGLQPAIMSTASSVGSACEETLNDLDAAVWLYNAGTISVGDDVFDTSAGLAPFVGNGDYYNFQVDSIVGNKFSAKVNASGTIIGSIFLCV